MKEFVNSIVTRLTASSIEATTSMQILINNLFDQEVAKIAKFSKAQRAEFLCLLEE